MLRKGARYDRLLRVGQDHVEAPRIGDLRLDVVVRRERRREIGDVREPITQPDVLDEVRGVREPHLARSVVHRLQARRAGHEMDAVLPEVGVGEAVAVVEDERARGRLDGRLDDRPREEHAAVRGRR